ncbi:pyrroline-5-carboxylate reductase [Aspergillus sclerotioniger CBS 115572]|uniref:Pyrroline-5-carboxylate reductase n=1 Tax=Aspergillus sclerotioniger CBS 115572 TaxID=1450535 RepID=A0A317XH00_9EURO|nr:pyrroline-5-carboxylate reductase [Aspergillus sclerotioniger CBS 115572]PWY96688.1 pyrroline-5-carboxylate reductase [Aspergillus sclerotioniger CBS 115572]
MVTQLPSPAGKQVTLAFIGCGNMGSAILSGLLDATRTSDGKINHFMVSTKTASSAERLRTQYSSDLSRIEIAHESNLSAMRKADIILLACKPFLAKGILSAPGVGEALSGKLVISIMAGMTPKDILSCLSDVDPGSVKIVRAMPNVAARLRKSMTIVEVAEGSGLGEEDLEIVTWVFEAIGKVKFLAPELFDVGTMLVGASMGVMTVPVEGVLDGCVVEGLRRGEALEMMAQTLEGMAALLREGEHPAILRESISSPRGCTIQGVMTVERAGVRATFADAMIDGTRHLGGKK